jgi:hypothetical protein
VNTAPLDGSALAGPATPAAEGGPPGPTFFAATLAPVGWADVTLAEA